MIRIRSINSDNVLLRPESIQQARAYWSAGVGPHMPAVGEGGSGPLPSRTIFDRFNAPVFDRFGAEIETRF